MTLKKIDPKAARAEVEEYIATAQVKLDLALEVLRVLEAYEGKQITKRLATAVEKALPDRVVHYSTDFGMYHIKIWGDGLKYGEGVDMLIGYNKYGTNPTFSIEKAREYNRCFTLNKERIKALKARLHILEPAAELYNRRLEQLEEACTIAMKNMGNLPDSPDFKLFPLDKFFRT